MQNLLTGKRTILWLWLIEFQHTQVTQVPVPSNHSAKFCLWGTSGLYSWSLLSTFQSSYLQASFKLIFRSLSSIILYHRHQRQNTCLFFLSCSSFSTKYASGKFGQTKTNNVQINSNINHNGSDLKSCIKAIMAKYPAVSSVFSQAPGVGTM